MSFASSICHKIFSTFSFGGGLEAHGGKGDEGLDGLEDGLGVESHGGVGIGLVGSCDDM